MRVDAFTAKPGDQFVDRLGVGYEIIRSCTERLKLLQEAGINFNGSLAGGILGLPQAGRQDQDPVAILVHAPPAKVEDLVAP
jgi:hypothetical protein